MLTGKHQRTPRTDFRPSGDGGQSTGDDETESICRAYRIQSVAELFTLSQLQSLYEAIYGEPMDKRNFRKRVAEMDFIEKTDKIDKLGSKRGAALYKFNGKAYRKDPKFKL